MGTLARISTRIFLILIFSALLAATQTTNAQCVFNNNSFETGNLSGWTTYQRSQNLGDWYNYTGTASPLTNHTIAAPSDGTRAAVTDHNAKETVARTGTATSAAVAGNGH